MARRCVAAFAMYVARAGETVYLDLVTESVA
jgi:hypothetical protein